MLQLLDEQKERLWLHPDDIISLTQAGLRGGSLAMRPLNEEHLALLAQIDPKTWPPVKITSSNRGYILVDGNHRLEIARQLELKKLFATCQSYQTENDVVEAAFTANFTHGLKASQENRSDYAYWLHISYPEMEQAEIARRAGITQSTVSRGIARREEELRELQTAKELDTEETQRIVKKSCHKFRKSALQFLTEVEQIEDSELIQLFQEVLRKKEEKQKFSRLARLLNTQI